MNHSSSQRGPGGRRVRFAVAPGRLGKGMVSQAFESATVASLAPGRGRAGMGFVPVLLMV